MAKRLKSKYDYISHSSHEFICEPNIIVGNSSRIELAFIIPGNITAVKWELLGVHKNQPIRKIIVTFAY